MVIAQLGASRPVPGGQRGSDLQTASCAEHLAPQLEWGIPPSCCHLILGKIWENDDQPVSQWYPDKPIFNG